MTIPSDEIIGQLKLGAVLRAADGRRFVIKGIRKVNDGKEANMMHTASDDAITEITKLEQQVNDLESLLKSAIGKQADDIGKTLSDAIATVDNEDSFVRVADDIARRDGCSRLVALQKARLEALEQFRRYQLAGVEMAKTAPVRDRIRGPSAFDAVVQQIVRDKKVPGHIAMQLARKADPDLFKAYQAGE
jgi:hypothetical protein